MKRTFTTTVTSEGQITIPKALAERLGLKRGDRISIYPVRQNRFVAQVHRPSRILDYCGDLKDVAPKQADAKQEAGVVPYEPPEDK